MEHSPAESFMSAPSGDFPSLFATPASSSGSPAMNPMDMMSPASVLGDDFNPSRSSLSPEDGNTPNEGEKKQKKRKSWGQVLPEPKTNLPPRKRAKTEDEKEQRRVERVLRNRRAAQSSRERKRLEVEALEQRNKELEHALKQARETNHALLEQLQRQQHSKGVLVPSVSTGSPLEHTLSSQLFESKALKPGSLDKLGSSPTVNPASLSPKPSEIEFKLEELSGPTGIPAASSDTTQRPAAMLCDLQCLSEQSRLLPISQIWARTAFLLTLISTSILSTCQHPLMQIAMSLKGRYSIAPSPQVLTTIIRLVTSPTSPLSTWTTGSTVTPLPTFLASSRKASTLRVKLLKKILSSSPNLARPLMDATFAALRLVSRGHDNRVEASIKPSLSQGVDRQTDRLKRIDLPSREVLLTLIWTLKVQQQQEKRRQLGAGSNLEPESLVPEFRRRRSKHGLPVH